MAEGRVVQGRFNVGQRVGVHDHALRSLKPDSRKAANFEVIRALPQESAIIQYRVQNLTTGQQFVFDESDLHAVP